MKNKFSQTVWIPMVVGLAIGGCSSSQPEPAPAERVENPELGIAIAALPAPFVVTANQGPVLELQAPGEAGPADLYIETTAEIMNLNAQKARNAPVGNQRGEFS